MEKTTVIHMSHSAEIQIYPRSNTIIVLHTYDFGVVFVNVALYVACCLAVLNLYNCF